MTITHSCRKQLRRPGKVIVTLAVVLITLLGMIGLVIDSGLLMAANRIAQNAADGAALAAAMDMYRGDTADNAKNAATRFVKEHNGLANATVTVNIPPASGPFAGNYRYVEVLVTNPVSTHLIQVLGISSAQDVNTRAVAGYEANSSGEGAIVLDPEARPGLGVDGGATLVVDGAVIVNSRAAGVDQYGVPVDYGLQQYALVTSNNSTMKARFIQVKGGVDVPANYINFDPNGPNPLFCRGPISPDPLREVPVPTNANGVNPANRGAVTVSNSSPNPTYLDPGIYSDIQITKGAVVIFNPGIYVLSPTGPNMGLRINGDAHVTGLGVMFYVTGSNYSSNNGYGSWDHQDDLDNNFLDGPLPPTNGSWPLPDPPDPDFSKVDFATIDMNITGGTVTMTGLQDPNSPYKDMLFFQRRRNMKTSSIQGKAGQEVNLAGTIYARWARFNLAGEGKYDAQFVVGSMSIAGQAVVTINSTGKTFGRANQVYLVE